MGATHAVRFPVATLIAFAVMCIFFTILASVIDKHVIVITPTHTKINFTRLIIDSNVVPDPKPPVRPPLPPPISVEPLGPTHFAPGDAVVAPPLLPPLDPLPTGSRGIDHDPIPSVRINPIYPARWQSAGIEGWVQVQFDITASGSVTNVEVIDAQPKGSFDAAATSAVARWKYDPMVRDGRAVERRGVRVVLRFQLDD